MSQDKNQPQTLSEDALDQASGGADHSGGVNVAVGDVNGDTSAKLGDGSVKPGETVGIIAVAPAKRG